jgi:hypothetical protein
MTVYNYRCIVCNYNSMVGDTNGAFVILNVWFVFIKGNS